MISGPLAAQVPTAATLAAKTPSTYSETVFAP